MPAFAQFAVVAVALFLWESTLWLPLGSVALRRRRGGKRLQALDPRAWFAARETGLIPMLPLPPDAGLAPCQVPPLLATGDDRFLMESGNGTLLELPPPAWTELRRDSHHLLVGAARVRISSPRCIEFLHREKLRGASPAEAVRRAWKLALSPIRAEREWRRWRLVSAPLRVYGPVLTLGFFAGLPLTYVYLGGTAPLYLALWLWCLMAVTAGHFWWLGKRVYPDAGAALRMDAVLALLVPFHAMRASEIASVHAMGLTHPAAMILHARDYDNPWLRGFMRRLPHPLPGNAEEALSSSFLHGLLDEVLRKQGRSLAEFDTPPAAADDPDAASYCPRCHAIYQKQAATCADCPGLELRRLPT